MILKWPSERITRTGLMEFALAAAGLIAGIFALRRAGVTYLRPGVTGTPMFVFGLAALILCAFALFRIVRRGEYPWILAFAAIALPLFEPSQAPYVFRDRVVMGVRDLALVGATVVYVIRALFRSDELERRTHLEALSWSYAVVVLALVCHALLEDVVPLRGTWIGSAMLGSWFVAWIIASMRYQR
jgi:hypothetical protein